MDGLVKFSDYDIFGYLASGLVVLALCDTTLCTHIVFDADWTVAHSAFVVIAAYMAGHIVAAGATLFFDRLFVRNVFGRPSDILMNDAPAPESTGTWLQRFNWRKWLLSGFLEPLMPEVQRRVLARAGLAASDGGRGEKAFWRAWPVIKRDALPYARMESFLRLYAFCRNMSFVSFVAAIVFLFRAPSLPDVPENSWYPFWAALLVSVAMFHRYLKFFRAYSAEVFSTYAEPAESPSATPGKSD